MSLTVLGVDPGTIKAGTVVLSDGFVVRHFRTWLLRVGKEDPILDRLMVWDRALTDLLTRFQPGIVAVENPTAIKNNRTVDALGRFVGVTTVLARRTGAVVLEYRPSEHRARSTGKQWSSADSRLAYQMLKKQVTFSKSARGFLKFGFADEHTIDALSMAIVALREYQDGQATQEGI